VIETKGLLYAGIFMLGAFAIMHYYLYLRLRDIGIKKTIFDFLLVAVPVEYLRNRAKHGWPVWPVYLMLVLLLAGISVFVIGVSRL
jgi:hypothetical protein